MTPSLDDPAMTTKGKGKGQASADLTAGYDVTVWYATMPEALAAAETAAGVPAGPPPPTPIGLAAAVKSNGKGQASAEFTAVGYYVTVWYATMPETLAAVAKSKGKGQAAGKAEHGSDAAEARSRSPRTR
jgi:hypothetical protein